MHAMKRQTLIAALRGDDITVAERAADARWSLNKVSESVEEKTQTMGAASGMAKSVNLLSSTIRETEVIPGIRMRHYV